MTEQGRERMGVGGDFLMSRGRPDSDFAQCLRTLGILTNSAGTREGRDPGWSPIIR
jgi:hypothetical protein